MDILNFTFGHMTGGEQILYMAETYNIKVKGLLFTSILIASLMIFLLLLTHLMKTLTPKIILILILMAQSLKMIFVLFMQKTIVF